MVDTGDKFTAGVLDNSGNWPPASLTPVANLPPASITPTVPVAKFVAVVVDSYGKFSTGVIDLQIYL